jgi:hypothetical protein
MARIGSLQPRGKRCLPEAKTPPHRLRVCRAFARRSRGPSSAKSDMAFQAWGMASKSRSTCGDLRPDGAGRPTHGGQTPGQHLRGGQVGALWSLARPYCVPAGRYFVMGDNRTDSDDSRYWGTVPQSAIIGQASFTYWPLGRIGGL